MIIIKYLYGYAMYGYEKLKEPTLLSDWSAG